MIMERLFIEDPYLEWHHNTPFVFAKLNINYSHFLAELALKYEPYVLTLPVHKKWLLLAAENPTGSRYSSYNTFLLHSAYMPLLTALKKLYYFYVDALQIKRKATYIQSWFNIHRKDQRLARHQHQSAIIGSFLAQTKGSNTRYGLSKASSHLDYIIPNEDGMLVMTQGPSHYHEVSTWENHDYPRVSYAFDIIDYTHWRNDKVLVPFDSVIDSEYILSEAVTEQFHGVYI